MLSSRSFIIFVLAYYSSFRSLVIQTLNHASSVSSKPGLIGQTKYTLEEGKSLPCNTSAHINKKDLAMYISYSQSEALSIPL